MFVKIIQSISGIRESKVARNSAAIIAGKIIQMVLSFIISIFSARYLGPGNFGIIGYAAAVVTFLIPVANLGLSSIMAYECIHDPKAEGEIFGTAVFMRLMSGILCVLGTIAFSAFFDTGEMTTKLVLVLYSTELLFKSFEIFESWFQIHYISKYTAISTFIAYIVVSIYKIYLLATGAKVTWFALAMALDYFVLSFLYFIFYKVNGGQKLTISTERAKHLWMRGKSFIISGLMVAVYLQTDKIMLKNMLSETEVGYYTLSSSLITYWAFVLAAIINATTPVILEYFEVDKSKFEKALVGRYSLIFYLCMTVAIIIFVLIKPVILVLYGDAYLPACGIARVLTFGSLFTYWGVAKGDWFVATNNQRYVKWLSFSGAVINVVLNYILIKSIGVIGAAAATVFSEMTVNFITSIFIKDIRISSIYMLKSINPKSLKNIKLLLK
ncbi:MAG: flippase [Clostridia bacterium]|nr:flippase [Clostridia bacterium]